MKNASIEMVFLLPLVFWLSACSTQPTPSTQAVAVHEVIDAVKEGLNAYLADKSDYQLGKENVCGFLGMLIPSGVTVTVRTATGIQSDPRVGLASPLGVIKTDTSFSGSHSTGNSTTISLPLRITRTGDSLSVDPENNRGAQITEAIRQLRDELRQVNHDLKPCLSGDEAHPLKVTMQFDVVDNTKLGFELQLVALQVGNRTTLKNEYHQTLEFELPLEGDMLVPPPQ